MTTLTLKTNLSQISINDYIGDLLIELQKLENGIETETPEICTKAQLYLLRDIQDYLKRTRVYEIPSTENPGS